MDTFVKDSYKKRNGSLCKPKESDDERAKVFVTGFGNSVDVYYLKKWFEEYCGDVRSAKIATDESGKSLGYGYVRFHRPQDAGKAVLKANGKQLYGKTLIVKPYFKVQTHDKESFRNVFVKGFGDALDDKQLRIYFRDNIGDVESAEVAKYDNGASKGYGYVCFYDPENALKAVRRINGETLQGKKLVVQPFIPKEQRGQEPNRNVFIKGFKKLLDDDDLRGLFEIFGEVESARVQKDGNGASKGYGYVCFKKWQDAESAVRVMNGYELESVVLTVCHFQSKQEREKELKNRNLHVRNLDASVDEEELEQLFEPYGKILSCRVDPSPRLSVKQGFVCFETAEEADEAIQKLHHRVYKGCNLQVSVLMSKEKYIGKKERGEVVDHCNFPRRRLDYRVHETQFPRSEHVTKKDSYGGRSKSMGNLIQPRIAANFNAKDTKIKGNATKLYPNKSLAANFSEKDTKIKGNATKLYPNKSRDFPKVLGQYMSALDFDSQNGRSSDSSKVKDSENKTISPLSPLSSYAKSHEPSRNSRGCKDVLTAVWNTP